MTKEAIVLLGIRQSIQLMFFCSLRENLFDKHIFKLIKDSSHLTPISRNNRFQETRMVD